VLTTATPISEVSCAEIATVNKPIQQDQPAARDLWQKLRAGFELEQYFDHPAVVQARQDYASDPALITLIQERASLFLYEILAELDKRDMPTELALLPVVESNFNPAASSGKGAAGHWQFMPNTARRWGLQQDWWYDGRHDPMASMKAALDYLEMLNQRFAGDWLLTIAAYNTGATNVNRAIRRRERAGKQADFWALPLASETRNHVPRLLAVASVVNDPSLANAQFASIPDRPALEKIDLDVQIDLDMASRLAEMNESSLRFLNAGYRQWATHPDSPQHLYLPATNARKLRLALAQTDPDSLVAWKRYEIKPGDNLSRIAKRFNTRVDVLQRVNDLRDTRIFAGAFLLIPLDSMDAQAQIPVINRAAARPVLSGSYTVRPGDTLHAIARRLRLSLVEILDWNQLSTTDTIYPGQRLRVAAPADVE